MKFLSLILLGCLTHATAGSTPARADGASMFNPAEIEAVITEYYSSVASAETSKISQDDIYDDVTVIAELIAQLEPKHYNTVIVHLGSDFRSTPTHRPAIELLMNAIYKQVAAELAEDRASHPVLTILDDVTQAYMVAYAFSFGRGVFKNIAKTATTEGLVGMPRFREIMRLTSESWKFTARQHALITGAGTAVGVTHALYDYLRAHRMDPKQVLNTAKTESANEVLIRATAIRDELQAALQGPTAVKTREQAEKFAPVLKDYRLELAHLSELFSSAGDRVTIADEVALRLNQCKNLSMNAEVRLMSLGVYLPADQEMDDSQEGSLP